MAKRREDILIIGGGLILCLMGCVLWRMLRYVFKITGGNIPLVGVGGVSSGADAYEKICAGASLVQVYTALVYKGPKLIFQIKNDFAKLLEANGFSSIKDAIGSKN